MPRKRLLSNAPDLPHHWQRNPKHRRKHQARTYQRCERPVNPTPPPPLATDHLLERTNGGTPSVFSRGGSLLPSIYADARYVDAVIVSGVTYYNGIYHVWHQCCQNHWDHAISKDLIHWQRLPPPIQPVTERTFDVRVVNSMTSRTQMRCHPPPLNGGAASHQGHLESVSKALHLC